MSDKKGVEKANKDTKKANKDIKKSNTLDLYNDTSVKASCANRTDTKMLKIEDIDTNEINISTEKPYSKEQEAYKNYILYDYDDEIIPLLRKFSKIIGRYKVFKDGKTMNFRCDDDELLKKYEEIFKYVSNTIGENFFTEPTYESGYGTHIKLKIHSNKTRFHINETPKKDTNYICSALIRMQSIYFKSKELKHYPQVFLEECRYRLDNGGLCIDASDESDNMPSEGEFNSEYESDNNDNNESKEPSKRSKIASKESD